MSSRPTTRTIYKTGVGCTYMIKNVETGEKFKAYTPNSRSDHHLKPWRSPKNTPAGEEFFKIKIGSKESGFDVVKFMNSVKFDKCLSECGKYEFIGERVNGEKMQRVSDVVKAPEKKVEKKIEPIVTKSEPDKQIEPEEIKEDILESEFCNPNLLEDIFSS